MLRQTWCNETRTLTLCEEDLVCMNHWYEVPMKLIGKSAFVKVVYKGANEAKDPIAAMVDISIALPCESDTNNALHSSLCFGEGWKGFIGITLKQEIGKPGQIDGRMFRVSTYSHNTTIVNFPGSLITQLYQGCMYAIGLIKRINVALRYRNRLNKLPGHCFLLEKAMLDKAQEKGT